MQATRGIADLITIPGMINLDFNDVKTIISQGGDAIMGVGTHKGENRAVEAARKAIQSPLLEDVSIHGAKGVLINIAADSNLTLFEVNEAMSLIHEAAGQEANRLLPAAAALVGGDYDCEGLRIINRVRRVMCVSSVLLC